MKIDEAVKIAAPYSKCSITRLMAFGKALLKLDAQKVEGDVVECGVWKGGGVVLARLLSPDRLVWLYDTFTGMANPSQHDRTRRGNIVFEGKSAASIAEVIEVLTLTGTMDDQRIRIVEGQVEKTLCDLSNVPEKIALLHLDTDWYKSTKKEIEVLWPRVQRKGILIVDDYGHWRGAKRAIDEYFDPPWNFHKIVIDYTAVLMVKV
jgi:hypothetical protein